MGGLTVSLDRVELEGVHLCLAVGLATGGLMAVQVPTLYKWPNFRCLRIEGCGQPATLYKWPNFRGLRIERCGQPATPYKWSNLIRLTAQLLEE